MSKYYEEWKKLKSERFRTLKKWLRYLPKRSTFKRYKILKWFGAGLLNRPYLWSFRPKEVTPAFYGGWILTLLPVMGLQTLLGTLLALALRANIMILLALQMVSNPLTVGILWPIEYKVGKIFLSWLDNSNQLAIQGTVHEVLGKGAHSAKGIAFLKVTLAVCIGAVILGYLMGLISSSIYRRFADRAITTYEEFVKNKEEKNRKKGNQN